MAFPEDGRVSETEDKKVEKYQDLAREIGTMWDVRTGQVIQVVMGALGSVPMNLENNLKVIDAKISVKMIQKCAMLSQVSKNFKKVARGVEERMVFLGFPGQLVTQSQRRNQL